LIHGVTADGQGLRVLRKRADKIEIGAIHPLKEGVPILGEVVSLRPRPEFPLLCDVTVELEARAKPTDVADREANARTESRSGPAQVATDEYRRNWDDIFARPRRKTELVN
jgi:hypothetical protein